MSELKCPFCQQELDTDRYYVHCHNQHCNTTLEMEGTEELWEALIRTRKALDVAVDALKDIDKTRLVANHKIGTQDKILNSGIVFCWTTPDEVHNALEQITALKQKDRRCSYTKAIV
jgi:hypothetical protein